MGSKGALLASSAMLAATIGTSAIAQPTSSNTIAELVVTAEKREQSLQDIPVAISAFTSEQRDIVGIQSGHRRADQCIGVAGGKLLGRDVHHVFQHHRSLRARGARFRWLHQCVTASEDAR